MRAENGRDAADSGASEGGQVNVDQQQVDSVDTRRKDTVRPPALQTPTKTLSLSSVFTIPLIGCQQIFRLFLIPPPLVFRIFMPTPQNIHTSLYYKGVPLPFPDVKCVSSSWCYQMCDIFISTLSCLFAPVRCRSILQIEGESRRWI